MSLTNWVSTQSYGIKLILGLSAGLIAYIIFRWLIHLANKSAKELGLEPKNRRLSQEDKLKRLLSMSQD